MKSLKQFTSGALFAAITVYSSGVSAQSASATSPAVCTQSGQIVTCTTTTTFNVPTGLNLQAQTGGSSFTLSTGVVTPVAPSGCTVTPASQSTTIGSSPTLNVGCAIGSGNYTFQWSKNGTNIAGATGQTYTLSPATDTATANSASYNVIVGNTAGSVSATAATVTVSTQSVIAPSSCSVTPASATVSVGGTQTLSASCGAGTSPFSYAWFKNNALIAGANSSSYTLTSADTASVGAQNYRVDVTNTAGTGTANSAVTVNAASVCSNNGTVNSIIDVNVGYKQVGSSNLFGTGNTYIVRLDVSASATTVGGLTALISHTEGIGSQRAFRSLVLSPCAGDFTSSAAIPLSISSVGTSIDLSINDPGRGVPNLTTGTWYVNVRNTACTANTRCDTLIDWLHY
jgi:beta-galactosidase